jgi:hypothetical protein
VRGINWDPCSKVVADRLVTGQLLKTSNVPLSGRKERDSPTVLDVVPRKLSLRENEVA